MNRKTVRTVLQRVLLTSVAVTMLAGVALSGTMQASTYHGASFVELMDKESIKVDHSSYLDGSVVQQLSDSIRDDQVISVIISLDIANLMDAYEESDKAMSFAEFVLTSEEAEAIRTQIASEQARILTELDELDIRYTLGEEYDILLSGFELYIMAADFYDACDVLGDGARAIVSEVYEVAQTELVENTVNVYETGIFNSSDVKYDGSGMVVAVLDTGLDYSHSAFSTENFTSTTFGLTYEQVAAVLGDTVASTMVEGLTVDDVYYSEKVPFGFDYADGDSDVYSTHNNHGTHVSGVITGNDDTITGVAPNAQLVSMKIFSDVYDSALSSWILSALEDCVVLGVDVINMSLGTACGFSRESDEEAMNGVYDRIRAAGISMVVAASNSYSSAYGSEANGNLPLTSNPDSGTVGSPSTYAGTISVASINGVETPYILFGDTIIYFDESNDAAGNSHDFAAGLLGEQETLEIEYVVIPGVGRSADYTGMDVTGKIVLVRRGDSTFEEKALIAEAQGAAGIIIYNNVSGEIKMNVGDATLPVCSISQDDGEMLVEKGSGTLTFSKSQTSGPFISDFSSWGPTPSLGIKPEITAHGGNILSSVTGGGYDRLSGTSMACPNLSGVVILLRQYVVENFPAIADDNIAVNDMVNKLMMSTADIVLNTNGLPYSVRKQGAGLASLTNSVATTAYITTYDRDGKAMDKPKLELGDDPDKTGVYEMSFDIVNFGSKDLSYDLNAYIFTEGVSDTKTNAGETTVTEEAYLLNGATFEITAVNGGSLKDNRVSVAAGETANVTVVITLGDEDKAYLDESFENGMYVEGFITLTAEKGTEVDLNVPYLAFYGDWTQAPVFDLTYFDTHADELNMGIDEEDKTKADAYPTRLVGGISEDYVSYLGTYYFLQDPNDMVISANENYIALSNQEGTVHSLRFIWAGMLRNAARIEVAITDDTTGEVIFECVDEDVRKSYGDGGSIYPANIEIEFDTMDYNLSNNTEYTVSVVAWMDYGDGGLETNEKNTYSFPLVVDFEAPTVTDVQFYYEYDDTLKKNRLYADIYVYDNHYAMSMQVGYVAMGTDENDNETPVLYSFEQYMTPIYSQRNGTTVVTYELTDYIFEIKDKAINSNTFVVTCYDYAVNYAAFEIGLPDDYTDFYYDGLEEGLTLSLNEVYSLEPLVTPDSEWAELLEFASSKPSVVRVVNNKLVACSSGSAIIRIRDPKTNESVSFTVTVLDENDDGFCYYDKPVCDIFRLTGYETGRAYYIVDSTEKDIGDTGDIRFFDGNYELSLYPSEMVCLTYDLDAYFPNDTTVSFESSNENIVTVDAYGNVTAVAEGFASVTVKVMQDGMSTYYSETVNVEVKDPYITSGATLTNYYGLGGVVTIPEDLDLQTIGSFAFSNYEFVPKNEEEYALDDSSISKQWFIGDNTITKVIIPEGVKIINSYAFASLTALEEIVLPSTLESIEYGAFYGCTSLQKISFSSENNLKIINQNAFENCDLQGTLTLPSICVISDYAFAGNVDLKGIELGENIYSIGKYAFAGCKKLTNVSIGADKIKYGEYAFTGCESLESYYVNSAVIPAGMFHECKSMTGVTLSADVTTLSEFAFRSTAIETFTVEQGNGVFRAGTAAFILSADGSTLCAVSPVFEGEFAAAQLNNAGITVVGRGAFSHNTKISSVVLDTVIRVEDYGFCSSENLVRVTLGELTSIGEYAFFETPITELPAFTADTFVGKYAFAYTDITSVTIPDGMTVEEGVFSECGDLTTVVIGDNVVIGDFAFNLSKDYFYTVDYDVIDGTRFYHYVFLSNLTSLTIGENAVIGSNAFMGACNLESIALGAGAEIGYMAFYNNCSLKSVDLSAAVSIGDYAFSGDVYYACLDEGMAYGAVDKNGYYVYSYYSPALESVDLSAAGSVGLNAFSYCRELKNVVLGEQITELTEYVFAGCSKLESVTMPGVTAVGDYAFVESGLPTIDLSGVSSVGEYAFAANKNLAAVVLSPNGTDLGEGVFAECALLAQVDNLNCSANIGAYAFAYTALTEADLSGAVSVGDFAFLKTELTPFRVTLGSGLTTLGDNPFALCALEPFSVTEVEIFNGVEYPHTTYTYEISDTVFVIDGSLYCAVPSGMELIVYAGTDHRDAKVAEGTVRITAYAFAGSDVKMITLPYTTTSIGHKAFFACDELETVVFGSYRAPILEEEFDSGYYESFQHIPGIGNYGTYTDYDGTEVSIDGIGLVPYYMWNVTSSMYSNVFYGANFMDYVGCVDEKITMVRPINGETYDSYIYGQYFNRVINGAAAADDVTLAAIKAIDAIPERVSLEDAPLVEAARTAYSKIATTVQQSLVTNYAKLVSAEQRIKALSTVEEEPGEETPEEPPKTGGEVTTGAIVVTVLLTVAGVAALVWSALKKDDDAPEHAEKGKKLDFSAVTAKVKSAMQNAKDAAAQRKAAKQAASVKSGEEEDVSPEESSEEENDEASVR